MHTLLGGMLAAHRYSSSHALGAVAVALPRLCLMSCMYSSSRSSALLMPCAGIAPDDEMSGCVALCQGLQAQTGWAGPAHFHA